MNFSVNQASHLYVAKRNVHPLDKENGNILKTTAVAGDISIEKTADGKSVYFIYYGEGGLLRSDLIDIDKIMYINATSAVKNQIPLYQRTVSLNTDVSATPVAGQDYIIRIILRPTFGESAMIKYGVVRATKGMTASKFYEKMAESLTANFSRDITPTLEFEPTENGIIIKEVEQPWHLGTYPLTSVNFEVYTDMIIMDGMEVNWGNVSKYPEESGDFLPNSKKIADLEYFCMGERGDQYKNCGWPNVVPTKYMVDSGDPDGYAVINIHYSYVGSNESVQKSEKDLFIVGDTSTLVEIANSIKEATNLDYSKDEDFTSL